MTWKKSLNHALGRITGYQIVRRPNSQPPTRASGRGFPEDYDEQACGIIDAVRPYTMTHHDKLFALIYAARHISKHQIPGDVVECGVWRGGSMHAVARALNAEGDTSRDLYLFDTFEGMPPPSEKDIRHDGVSAESLMARTSRDRRIWAVASLEDVREGFTEVPYPPERIHFVEGRVEDTVPEHAPEEISLLRLDTDWYESTRHELEHMYPRLVSGGILILDDYGWWQGARRATDEFLARTKEPLFLARIASGRIAVKP
jgi:O-methyltransferase